MDETKHQLTRSEVIVLGFLLDMPTHGYDLRQRLEETKINEWGGINIRSLYAILKKLEKKELIKYYEERVENAPPRKIYQTTECGVEAFRLSLMEYAKLLTEIPIHPFMLFLFFMDHIKEEDAKRKFIEEIGLIKCKNAFLKNTISNIKQMKIPKNKIMVPQMGYEMSKKALEVLDNFYKDLFEKNGGKNEEIN